MSVRTRYWQYSLAVLILGLGTVIFLQVRPFLGGILGAATIYILLRKQMDALTGRRHMRRSLAATLLLGEAILCFLIPMSLIVWFLVSRIQHINLDPQSLIQPVRHVADLIRDRTGYDVLGDEAVTTVVSLLPRLGGLVMEWSGSFALNLLVLVFVLYFMLIGGTRMERYLSDLIPFNRTNTRNVLHEVHLIVRSNAIVIPLLALIQGGAALLGYVLFKVPDPVLFGLLTGFATIIPLVGTAIVWAPLALYLGLAGHWGNGIGLAIYSLLVITHIDNVARFIMQKKMADTHPLITIFGVVIGLSLFGFMGVIFGPLLLAMFILCVDIFKNQYLDARNAARIPAKVPEKAALPPPRGKPDNDKTIGNDRAG